MGASFETLFHKLSLADRGDRLAFSCTLPIPIHSLSSSSLHVLALGRGYCDAGSVDVVSVVGGGRHERGNSFRQFFYDFFDFLSEFPSADFSMPPLAELSYTPPSCGRTQLV